MLSLSLSLRAKPISNKSQNMILFCAQTACIWLPVRCLHVCLCTCLHVCLLACLPAAYCLFAFLIILCRAYAASKAPLHGLKPRRKIISGNLYHGNYIRKIYDTYRKYLKVLWEPQSSSVFSSHRIPLRATLKLSGTTPCPSTTSMYHV